MSKKTEKVEEVLPEEADIISIEMTPEQRDEFVQFLADKKSIEKKEDGPEAKFRMHLSYRHNINGKGYGPGPSVEVPESLVGHLQVAESQAKEAEIKLNTSSKRMFEVLASGQSVPVRVK